MKKYEIMFAGSLLLFATSCEKDNDSNSVAVGDDYRGGKVAYVLQPGDPGYDPDVRHGFIAATTDQSPSVQWYNGSYTTTGALGTDLGTGQMNTTIIVSNQGAGTYAAKICDDLVLNGYNDWYLPSREELNKLYANRAAIGGFSSAPGNSTYWSSSEVVALTPPNAGVFEQTFSSGQIGQSNKENTRMVRAIRSF
jgi:hypothetical protein